MKKSLTVVFTDPVMHALHQRVVSEVGELPVIVAIPPEKYFQELAESIIGQQLSTKVAETITQRVRILIGEDFSPERVLAVSIEELRQVGLSYAKAQYLQNVAQAWVSKLVTPESYPEMSDEEIIADLIKIKGIGRWTVEMFLIFSLGRSDVFSVGDYALKKAVIKAYSLSDASKPTEILMLADQWWPHRSLASRLLWKSLELSPVS